MKSAHCNLDSALIKGKEGATAKDRNAQIGGHQA